MEGSSAAAMFEVGAELDAAGRYAEAFKAYAEANRLARPHDAYETVQASLDSLTEWKRIYTRDFIARHATKTTGLRPIFIVGMPRSGSTLVEQILASHSSVTGMGETNALPRVTAQRAADPPAYAAAYLAEVASEGAPSGRFTDKLLSNFYRAGLIRLMFPEAVILHTVRDPIDTCLSCFFSNFGDPRLAYSFDLGDLAKYYCAYREVMGHWRTVALGLVAVRYEAMVASPRAQVARILRACSLNWEDGCLRFHDNQRSISTLSAEQVRRPIYTSSVGRWRRYREHIGPLIAGLGDGR
jgi:hypothetical protein